MRPLGQPLACVESAGLEADAGDSDCDGEVDEVGVLDGLTWYRDADSDFYGDPDSPTLRCDRPDGYAANGDDGDDSAAVVSPSANESCNAVDDDRSGVIDDGAACPCTVDWPPKNARISDTAWSRSTTT